ncbi:26S proteasome non-ATPase regulatory subunit 6 isoform X2 [Cimex lectularius]|nr:26S proteasome non-ATPase regulatory subunit 6 isoform X2 [Cimex lectularius]
MEAEGVTPAYMELAQVKFALQLSEYQKDQALKDKLLNGIKQGNMAPYYKEVTKDLHWPFDNKLYNEMAAANTLRLAELEKEHENSVIDDEDQVSGLWQAKLDYLCSIGDKEGATALANGKLNDKTVPKTHRIDAVFALFRLSYFHGCDIKGMSSAIEKATELIEGQGDWSSRNKLKAYEGVWSFSIRDYTRAARLFVDVVPTFESYELADFGTIIRYTVLSCMIALPRCELKNKLMHAGVTAQALHSQYTHLKEYFLSLYDGRYADFLVSLAEIESWMKRDPLLHPHYRHYVQEMRLRAYKQILQAYRSLSLDYMAQSFGVTPEFIEKEVAKFAASGRLQCKIDSVARTVVTSVHLSDEAMRVKDVSDLDMDRSMLYKTTVKRGDILLNRLKKLARVMDF